MSKYGIIFLALKRVAFAAGRSSVMCLVSCRGGGGWPNGNTNTGIWYINYSNITNHNGDLGARLSTKDNCNSLQVLSLDQAKNSLGRAG